MLSDLNTRVGELENAIHRLYHNIREVTNGLSAKYNHPIWQCLTVIDLKETSIVQFFKISNEVKALRKQMCALNENGSKKYIFLNPSGFISVCWDIAKVFMSEGSRKKSSFKGEAELKKYIEECNIPKEYGGSCEKLMENGKIIMPFDMNEISESLY